MKFFPLLLLFFLATAACQKSNESPNPDRFNGTWIVKKHYADPGDGSGKYMDVTTDPPQYLKFLSGGTVNSNYIYFGLQGLQSFSVIDSTRIRFTFRTTSSQPESIYFYQFAGDTLILRPPCIEGCGIKMVKERPLAVPF